MIIGVDHVIFMGRSCDIGVDHVIIAGRSRDIGVDHVTIGIQWIM